MATAMEEAETLGYYDQLMADYTRRRDGLRVVLEEAGLPTLPVQGAYFLMANVSGFGFDDDVTFCRWLTSDIGVAAVPPSAFYLDPTRAPLLARFCFAKREETIKLAAERLRTLPERRVSAS
jgi:aspartate/methionine/tyrosine aminotransferase